jgi:hypothetical protein
VTVEATAAREILQGQRMPPEEIRAVLAADDPLLVRRLLELHGERLGEWLEEQRRLIASIERSLAGARGTTRPRAEDRASRPPIARNRSHALEATRGASRPFVLAKAVSD